jgi:thioredoxin 1
MEHLTMAEFKEKIYNPDESKDWKYKGTLPAIIDFYADWCGPCKRVGPVLEEIHKEYGDRISVYKVNTEDAPDVAELFCISSIPSILFIPKEGEPSMTVGAMPKSGFVKAIEEVLKVKA